MCSIYIHASYLKQTYFDMSIHEFPIEKNPSLLKYSFCFFGKNDKTQK